MPSIPYRIGVSQVHLSAILDPEPLEALPHKNEEAIARLVAARLRGETQQLTYWGTPVKNLEALVTAIDLKDTQDSIEHEVATIRRSQKRFFVSLNNQSANSSKKRKRRERIAAQVAERLCPSDGVTFPGELSPKGFVYHQLKLTTGGVLIKRPSPTPLLDKLEREENDKCITSFIGRASAHLQFSVIASEVSGIPTAAED